MKKIVIVALLASGLVACAQNQAPKEDSRLKEAYSACINTAEGSPEDRSLSERAECAEKESA